MPKMVCGPKKKKKKSRNVSKKRRDVPKKHTQLENDVLADPLGVRGPNSGKKKGMNAENGVRPKKKEKKVGTSRKNAGTSRKRHTQLKNDVLADPLSVRDSYLVQKKDMDAENGLRPTNYSAGEQLECRDVPEKTQERPEKKPYLPPARYQTT